jgi:hypothetical protein
VTQEKQDEQETRDEGDERMEYEYGNENLSFTIAKYYSGRAPSTRKSQDFPNAQFRRMQQGDDVDAPLNTRFPNER